MMLIKTRMRLAQEYVNVSPKASTLPMLKNMYFKIYDHPLFLRFILIILHFKLQHYLKLFGWGKAIAVILIVIDNK